MATVTTTEAAGYFASPKEPADPGVERLLPFNKTYATAPLTTDVLVLQVVPAGWECTQVYLRATVECAATWTIDVGLYPYPAGVLGSVVDIDCFADGVNLGGTGLINTLADPSGDSDMGAITTVDHCVVLNAATVTTGAAGTITGFIRIYKPLV